ncbi:MAG: hypothetical protein H6696_05560 [Deferribacteres bacterium]|nr:hypothetical protein [candidate division KSB1 bacterium]MCB9501385.1 hypothetical protein [Deferribacteres bacterium]
MAKKKNIDLEKLLQQNKESARNVVAQEHLDFYTLYALAQDKLTGEQLLQSEAHLAACEACRELFEELKQSAEFIETYQTDPIDKEVPQEILKNIPPVPEKKEQVFAKLIFSKDKILEHIQGLMDDVTDFVIKSLESDTEYLADVRKSVTPTSDFQIHYHGDEYIIATLPDQNILEVYVKLKDEKEQARVEIELYNTKEETLIEVNRIAINEYLKFVFSDIDLSETTYELRIITSPLSE